MINLSALVLIVLLAGCAAGHVDYVRPNSPEPLANTKIVNKPREAVWNASVPELGKQFFVINNLDKSSGLINVSYSGDPESYVDCGFITSYVKNARGERTYGFPGAKAQESYEIMNGHGWFFIDRRMSLEGRVNLVFEETGPAKTKVTANTHYVIERDVTVRNANNLQQTDRQSISFNAGSSAAFPPAENGEATTCVSTGKLEREILSVIR